MSRFLLWLLLGLGRLYRRTLSHVVPVRCRFYPSCSQYYMEALEVHGPYRGLGLALRRLARCQPFSRPGYDPVPPPRPGAGPSGPRPVSE